MDLNYTDREDIFELYLKSVLPVLQEEDTFYNYPDTPFDPSYRAPRAILVRDILSSYKRFRDLSMRPLAPPRPPPPRVSTPGFNYWTLATAFGVLSLLLLSAIYFC